MAGILDILGASGSSRAGLLSAAGNPPPSGTPWQTGLGLFGASLQDAGSYLNGSDNTSHLQRFQTENQQAQIRQQLTEALQSADPAVRQKGYTTAALLGIDTKPFQQQQATAAAPAMLASMQPHTGNILAITADLPRFNIPAAGSGTMAAGGGQVASGSPSADLPGLNLTDALAQSGSPELQAQYAPDLIKQQIDLQGKAATTLSPEEAVAAGFRPGAVIQRDAAGNLKVAQASDMKSQAAADQQIDLENRNPNLPIARANLANSQQRLAFDQQKLQSGVPDDATLHDMATRFVNGDRQAAVGISRNPAVSAAFQRMVSQVGQERGLSQAEISRNQQTFAAGSKAVQAFDTGKQGDTTRSLNVSVAHLNTLKDLGAALQNGDITLINSAKQKFAEAFGVPAPTNFDAARAIVADEVAKGVIGGQTAQSDREALAASLQRNRSPEAINGAINTFQNLLAGQLHGLRQQYQSSTGRQDFNDKLFPETISVLEGAHPANKKPAGPTSPQSLPRLPSGTSGGVKWKIVN